MTRGPIESRDPTIGTRIRARRQILDFSVRHTASKAGISAASWSRIENGLQGADNRFTLGRIAEALGCSPHDLTDYATPADSTQAALDAAAHKTMLAVTDTHLDYEPTVALRPVAELRREVSLLQDLRHRCDYLGVNHRLPDALRQLHAVAVLGDPDDRCQALGMLVEAADVARVAVQLTSQVAGLGFVAERGWDAAQALGDPVLTGLAGWGVTQAALTLGLYPRAQRLAERSFDLLSPHAGADNAAEVMGQLLLCAAYAHRAMGNDPTDPRMAEALRLAEATGETDTFGLFFGPTNVSFWRVGMEVDGGDPGRAAAVGSKVNPTHMPVSRQAAFHIDLARALARTRQDASAVRQLLAVERIALQRVQSDKLVAETARALLERSRREAGGTQLRGLCKRLGL